MARHNPAGFAFGMLLEIAAVVVIVSLVPRFDLRPKTEASEPSAAHEPTVRAPWNLVNSTSPAHEKSATPISSSRETNWPTFQAPSSPATGSFSTIPTGDVLASHEVEQRLDRASQRLVNELGNAAADLATNVIHVASRPALSTTTTPPSLPSFPTTDSRHHAPQHLSPLAPPPSRQTTAQQPRRWVNY